MVLFAAAAVFSIAVAGAADIVDTGPALDKPAAVASAVVDNPAPIRVVGPPLVRNLNPSER